MCDISGHQLAAHLKALKECLAVKGSAADNTIVIDKLWSQLRKEITEALPQLYGNFDVDQLRKSQRLAAMNEKVGVFIFCCFPSIS